MISKRNLDLNIKVLFVILFIIMVISLLSRIYQLDSESLNLEEMFSVEISKKTVAGLIERTSQDVHPPIYYIILHFWMKLFGDTEISVRFPSVIFGVASIFVIYKFGKLIFNKEVGILSALILSISIFHIVYSQYARAYTLLTLLILVSNYYFIKILDEKNRKNRKDTSIYVISTAAMLLTHNFGLFYIAVQNIYYFLFKKNIRYWLTVQVIIFLIFMPWTIVLIKQMMIVTASGGPTEWIPRPTLFNIYDTFKFYAGTHIIGLFLFIIIVYVDIFGNIFGNNIFGNNKNNESSKYKHRNFLYLWLFIPVITIFIISIIFKPIYINRYMIGSLPAFLLILSIGIYNFRKYSVVSVPILLMILILPSIPTIGIYYNNIEGEQWRDIANYIENNKTNDDTILLYVSNIKVPFGYYYKNDSNIPILDKISHTGYNSVKIDLPGKLESISGELRSDRIGAKNLQNYTFSVWAKTQNIGKNAPAVRIIELDKNGKVNAKKNIIFENTEWKQKNITFRTNASTQWFYIQANIWNGYGTFWIDDLSLANDIELQNIIPNPGFEQYSADKLIGWNYIKKDPYFGLYNANQVENFIQGKKGVWLILSHTWSSNMKKEARLIKDKLSKRYNNQSKIKFIGAEIIYYKKK